jgi:hypothetical protein
MAEATWKWEINPRRVENVVEVFETSSSEEVNEKLKLNWILLFVGQYSDTDSFWHSGEPIYNSDVAYVVGRLGK